MARRDEQVTLTLDDDWSAHFARLRKAAEAFGAEMALHQATWEPHDWSDLS